MNGVEKTSPWVYVAIGCGAAIVLAIAAVGGVAWWGYRVAKRTTEQLTNPEARAASVSRTLGATSFPDGYHPAFSFSFPKVFELAVLTDRLDASARDHKLFKERGFVYVKTLSSGSDRKKLDDYFSGTIDGKGLMRTVPFALTVSETVGRGTITRDDMTIRYVAQVGTIERLPQGAKSWSVGTGERNAPSSATPVAEPPGGGAVEPAPSESSDASHADDRLQAVVAVMGLDCPQDSKMRMGIWFAPPPAAKPDAAVDWTGTPADEAAIRAFLSHFSPCPK